MSRSSSGRNRRHNRTKSLNSLIRKLFNRHKWIANKRGLAWDLDFEQWLRLVGSDCYLCGKPPANKYKQANPTIKNYGMMYKYQGLDRIDNAVGYVGDNVAPCCKVCNGLKSDLSLKDFKNHVMTVILHGGLAKIK